MTESELTRFWAKVRESGECWQWTGARQKGGYGKLGMRRPGVPKTALAHRLAYEHWRGPIPVGLTIDHLCRNPGCVNPWHLETVSMAVNIKRGIHAKTPVMRARIGAALKGRIVSAESRAKISASHKLHPHTQRHTAESKAKIAATKRGKPRPWTPEWRAALSAAKRAQSEAQTHCTHGHLYDEANTGYHGTSRFCRTCKRITDNERYHLKAELAKMEFGSL